jgi:hypothetical protein
MQSIIAQDGIEIDNTISSNIVHILSLTISHKPNNGGNSFSIKTNYYCAKNTNESNWCFFTNPHIYTQFSVLMSILSELYNTIKRTKPKILEKSQGIIIVK